MANIAGHQLRQQQQRAIERGWIPFFEEAAEQFDFPVDVLMALASRESNMTILIGDSGHGYGLMQIDNRYYGDWVATGAWRDPRESILMGAQVLAEKRSYILGHI